MPDPNFNKNAGFGNSAIGTFTIGSGADGSAVDPIDLLRHYAFVVVRSADVSNAGDPTDLMNFEIDMVAAGDMLDLKDSLGLVTIAMDTAFHRTIFVGGARRIRAVLDAVTSGGSLVVEFYGIDAATEV